MESISDCEIKSEGELHWVFFLYWFNLIFHYFSGLYRVPEHSSKDSLSSLLFLWSITNQLCKWMGLCYSIKKERDLEKVGLQVRRIRQRLRAEPKWIKGKKVCRGKNYFHSLSHSPELKFSMKGSLEDIQELSLISYKTVWRLGHRQKKKHPEHLSNRCLSSTQQSLVTFSKTPALNS